MTRWADHVAGIQDALAAAIRARREASAADLPTPIHASFEVIGTANRGRLLLAPNGVRVFPPSTSTITAETTNGYEGVLTFPCIVTVRTVGDLDVLDLLREAVGLVVDAVTNDSTLGGLTGGTGDPGITLGAVEAEAGAALQEVGVRFHVRYAPG